jgi:hypothetical protein
MEPVPIWVMFFCRFFGFLSVILVTRADIMKDMFNTFYGGKKITDVFLTFLLHDRSVSGPGCTSMLFCFLS